MTRTYLVRCSLGEPGFPTVTRKGSRSARGQSWLTNAFTHGGWISFLCLFFFAASVNADVYTLPLSYNDAFLNNPYYVENAFLRTEAFAPNVKYWQPSQPNVEGIVTLKFDTPFNIQSASFLLGISAYTVGTDLNLDSNASAFLDVSTDNVNWTQVASQTNQNATNSGISGPWDISSIVSGSNVVYIRSRLFTTTSYSGYSAAQFNRQGAPYDPGYFTATGGILPECPTTVALEFNGDAGGAIKDINGTGTGFTDWLPGTGGSIPRNDPNLNLQTMSGYLAFSSQRANIHQFDPSAPRNLPTLDAPGVLLTDMVGKDFHITAKFDDLAGFDQGHQLALYVGTNSEKSVRGGFHPGVDPDSGLYYLAGNTGSGDFFFPQDDIPTGTHPSGPGTPSFDVGDDVILSLSRVGGSWSLEWQNLTNPANSRMYSGISMPWLDNESDLYAGIMHLSTRNVPANIAKIDYFHVTVCVPEPAGMVVVGIASVGLLASQSKRRRG